MRISSLEHRHVPTLAGLAVGCGLAALLVGVGGAAVAQPSREQARAIFEVTHLPPLLTLPGESVDLSYDVHCARDGVEDPEASCDATGTVYLRKGPHDAFRAIRLEPASVDGLRRLTATVPAEIVAGNGEFEYYAELAGPGTNDGVVVPAGGPAAPHRSFRLSDAVDANLGVHSFGSARPGIRIVSAPWGDGPESVGLEGGRTLPAIGASAFDVGEDGAVTLLDEAHRRALRWPPNGGEPSRVPLAIDGRLADLSVDEDGSMYVLESVTAPGRTPLVRHFDPTGRELDAVNTAEPVASQVRTGPDGPVVLQHPSHQWMPVADGGVPTPPRDQRRNGRIGRPLRLGTEIVVLRREHDILAAVVSNRGVGRSWRVASGTPLAEIQLAEPIGRRLVLVVRVYSDVESEFVVLVLDQHGIARTFSTPTDEWAEATPLGRFRIAGNRLYRLGSDASRAFVASYDLEGS
jgi:hypothetical protein